MTTEIIGYVDVNVFSLNNDGQKMRIGHGAGQGGNPPRLAVRSWHDHSDLDSHSLKQLRQNYAKI